MRLIDSWRLTGPNLQTHLPAVQAEVAFDPGDDPATAAAAWKRELARMAGAVGLSVVEPAARFYKDGVALTFIAPIDVLLAATDVNDWAVASASAILAGGAPLPLEPQKTVLADALRAQKNPALVALAVEARKRDLAFILDDEAVTLGVGKRSRTWALAACPRVSDVNFAEVGAVPVVLVTGTNGKTTSSRLVARMARCAGLTVGATTSDGVAIDDETLEHGDYTGPAGARLVLRSPEVDAAVLETARGGILRRGLAIDIVDGALVTNVSDDHLGGYGVFDLETMARVKMVVATVVRPSGRVVLNADDPRLVALASTVRAPVVFFSLDAANPTVRAHLARGGEAWFLRDDTLYSARGQDVRPLVRVDEMPFCIGGAARYNIANALGSAALAKGLGVPHAAIAETLRAFGSTPQDNPGRANRYECGGVEIIVDFAHNPDSIRNLLDLVSRLRSAANGRLFIIAGYAGDRDNDNIRDSAREIAQARPTHVYLRDLPGYLRGRAPGEVPGIMRDELTRGGVAASAIETTETEVSALTRALDAAAPGDLVVLMVHLERDAVRALLEARGATQR